MYRLVDIRPCAQNGWDGRLTNRLTGPRAGVVIVMDRQGETQATLMIVDLDSFVPRNHLLRLIKRKVDFTFVYEKVKGLYKYGGRPSYDPVVLLKMWLIGYLYNIASERQLEQEANLNLAYRWFLGIPLDKRVPDHSTLSENWSGRFQEGEVFLGLFDEVVQLCKNAGLVQGEAVVTDSTHVRANASNERREQVVVTKKPREYIEQLKVEAARLNEEKREQRGGKTRVKTVEDEPELKTETKSCTDPDAGMMARTGKPCGFHYLAHMAVNPAHGIILSVVATPGNVPDHTVCVECITAAKERHPEIAEAAADAGYDYTEVHKRLAEIGVTDYIPAIEKKSGKDAGHIPSSQFSHDPEADAYRCPADCTLGFNHVQKENYQKIYAAKTADCKACSLKDTCISQSKGYRVIKRALFYDYTEQAHIRVGSTRYKQLQRLRSIWSEGTVALLKARHCMRRAIRRGLKNALGQFLLSSTAVNLKRLVLATR